jgi:hypothetical protein
LGGPLRSAIFLRRHHHGAGLLKLRLMRCSERVCATEITTSSCTNKKVRQLPLEAPESQPALMTQRPHPVSGR